MENETRIDLRPTILWTMSIFVVMALMSVYAWFALPANIQMATHWSLEGKPDGWSSKSEGLSVIPVCELVLGGMWLLLLRFMPRRLNVARSARGMTAVWAVTLLLLLAGHAVIIVNALGLKLDATLVGFVGVGILFIVIGNYMGKLRSNFFAGIKTPWTLSSDLSWDKTNRLGGKLFVTAGIVLILGRLMGDPLLWVWLLLAQTVAILTITCIYSYKLWKLDPNKYAEKRCEEPQGPTPAVRVPSEGLVTWGSIALLVVIALASMMVGTMHKPQPGLEQSARELVSNLAAGNYEEAEARFDTVMRQGLPPDKMRAAWESALAGNGKFVRQMGTRTSRIWPYTIVYVTCKFERTTMDIKVVFSSSGKVSGLWIVPSQEGGGT